MLGYKLQSKELDDLRQKAESIGASDELALVMGRAAASTTKDHLYALDQSRPNKLGGKRTNFYQKAGDSVSQPQSSGGTVSFTITKLGLAQRWLGGDIEAGKGTSSFSGGLTKYLAIPARAESYGVPPSEFPDLRFVPRRNGGGMLVQALQSLVGWGKKRSLDGVTIASRSRGQRGGLVMYWLVTDVHQDPDPTVMPTEQELLDSAVTAGSQELARRLAS